MKATKMEFIRVPDLEHSKAVKYLKVKRGGIDSDDLLNDIVANRIGGRISRLYLLAQDPNTNILGSPSSHLITLLYIIMITNIFLIIELASRIEKNEKVWLINKVGLIKNFEGPEEYESQKCAVAAWKLFREIVKSPTKSVPLVEARELLGSTRYLQQLDFDGVITIDAENNVKADSPISYNYFKNTIDDESENFDGTLNHVVRRLAEVEGREK